MILNKVLIGSDDNVHLYLREFFLMISFALVKNGGLGAFVTSCRVSAGQPSKLPGSRSTATVVVVTNVVLR